MHVSNNELQIRRHSQKLEKRTNNVLVKKIRNVHKKT